MLQRSQFEARGSDFSEGTGEYTVAVSRASQYQNVMKRSGTALYCDGLGL
jgi:hypothetical protein